MNKEAILEGLLFVVGDEGITLDNIVEIMVWYDIGNILQNNSKKTVFYVNSGNFPEFFKIFQKCNNIMQSGPLLMF